MEFLDGYEAVMRNNNPLTVTRLRISGYELDAALQKIKTFQNLERFECSWGGSWSHIPDAILKLPKLKYLSFQRNYLSEIPVEITYAEQLEILDLSHNNIHIIPQELSSLKKLRELNLDKNPIREIEEAVLELASLKELNIAKAVFTQFPETLLKLIPQLSLLVLPRKLSTQFEKKYPELAAKVPYLYQWTSLEKKHSKNLKQLFYKEAYPEDLKIFLLNILAGAEKRVHDQLTIDKLLKAINLKRMESIRLKALEYLGQEFNEASRNALATNARICVQGKLGINKKELRQKLKDHKIEYTAKLDDKTTHYLLGQLPGESVYSAEEKGIHLITEKNIIDYWEMVENPYLLETANEAPEQLEGMTAMLTSNQSETISIALEMFKQGGFPKELITELFIAYKSLIDQPKIQREAERLLRQYGSADLIAKLSMENALFSYKLGESTTNSYLNKYAKHTELNSLKMARVVFHWFGSGQLYLIRHLPEVEALDFIESELMKDGLLDLSSKSLKAIPPIIYKLGPKLKRLKLKDNSLERIHEKIKVFTAMEEIDLRNNYRLISVKSQLKALLKEQLPNCKILM